MFRLGLDGDLRDTLPCCVQGGGRERLVVCLSRRAKRVLGDSVPKQRQRRHWILRLFDERCLGHDANPGGPLTGLSFTRRGPAGRGASSELRTIGPSSRTVVGAPDSPRLTRLPVR